MDMHIPEREKKAHILATMWVPCKGRCRIWQMICQKLKSQALVDDVHEPIDNEVLHTLTHYPW